MLQGLREISRETDKLLKQQILIRAKLENPSQENTKLSGGKTKEVEVPVKRKFENDLDKPTNIPAQPKSKTGTTSTAAPVLQKNYLSHQKSTASLRSSNTLDASQISIEVEVGEDIDLIGESLSAAKADRLKSQKQTNVLPEVRKAMKLEKRPNSSLSQAEMKTLVASASK